MRCEHKNIITVSRLKCFQACPRQHYYRYEVGMRRSAESKALRFGRIYHHALEAWGVDRNVNAGFDMIYRNYDNRPEYIEPFDWDVERETALRLFAGYTWYWQNDGIKIIQLESTFRLPIINPGTGRPTPIFERAGKVDGLVVLPDGRAVIMEHKTTGDSIAAESDYWSILRLDPQVSMYFDAAPEALGIIYDVTRRPSIQPKQVPLKDDMGFKIVRDAAGNRVMKKGGLPRESADTKAGHVLAVRIETPAEYGERLAADIVSRPEFYYARREVPRTDADMDEFRFDLWNEQQSIRDRQKRGCWPRRPSAHTCDWCEFKSPCFAGVYPVKEQIDGYIISDNVHPELEAMNGTETTDTHAQSACAGNPTVIISDD